jgi:DNA-binding CsgD family transcriptional regulator
VKHRVHLELQQLQELASALGDLSKAQTVDDVQEVVFTALNTLVPGSLITKDKIDFDANSYSIATNHRMAEVEKLAPHFGALVHQGYHPYIEYVRAGGTEIAVRTTDVTPLRQFERNPIFDEVYRPLDVPYGMFSMVRLEGPVPFINFAIVREKNFTDTEQLLARLYLKEVGRCVSRLIQRSNRVEDHFLANCRLCRLTPREEEVMLLLFKGKTDKEIACVAGTSARTVSNQVGNIFRKLGVRTRNGAVRAILEKSPLG